MHLVEASSEELIKEIERLRNELQASREELESFCYSVSHDLRGPLRSIDGFSLALLEDYADALDDAGQDYLRRVREASQRMGKLMDALLMLSRLIRAEMHTSELDITALARSVGEELLKKVEKPVEFVVLPGLSARADKKLVETLLQALIDNAIKFSAKVERPRIEVGATSEAFYVRDNGVGFNPTYSSKLFKPFEHLHDPREFPGVGTGLSAAKKIVERHGGKIWAEGTEGQGATFYFTLGDN